MSEVYKLQSKISDITPTPKLVTQQELDTLITDLTQRIEKLEAINAGLSANILELTQLMQPVSSAKTLVNNLAQQAKSTLTRGRRHEK